MGAQLPPAEVRLYAANRYAERYSCHLLRQKQTRLAMCNQLGAVYIYESCGRPAIRPTCFRAPAGLSTAFTAILPNGVCVKRSHWSANRLAVASRLPCRAATLSSFVASYATVSWLNGLSGCFWNSL